MPQDDPKVCLPCARRQLAGDPPRACGNCILLNADPFAQVRANAARPSPLKPFLFTYTSLRVTGHVHQISDRRHPTPTSWERGE